MRRFIFILMIALLPLRGWMGEAMATEMAAMNLIAAQAINTPATADLPTEISMNDCDMHKKQATSHVPAKPLCTHCQACHSTGLISAVQIPNFETVSYAQPLMSTHQFASASLAQSQKPPIL